MTAVPTALTTSIRSLNTPIKTFVSDPFATAICHWPDKTGSYIITAIIDVAAARIYRIPNILAFLRSVIILLPPVTINLLVMSYGILDLIDL
ncbi:hypothetical protein D3C79_925360 [compost metagenome]